MPLITRILKGSKLSIEEMDNNLTYLENLAVSQLRDYVQLQNKPLVIDDLDRWNTTKEIKFDNNHLYIDGPFTIRFTNHVNEGGPNYLFRCWDWDGPSRFPSTPYQNEEVVYNERAQISFMMESTHKSSLSLKSFDWTGGSQSKIEFDYKFYQGGLKLPINNSAPADSDGLLAFSDGNFWDPDSSGQAALNVRINGEWKQVNLGPGTQGPIGPIGNDGPPGPPGQPAMITDPLNNALVTSDGSVGGLVAQSQLLFDGFTFSILGDLSISGVVGGGNLKSPVIDTPQLNFAVLQGDTTLQNITTVLVDTVSVTTPTVDLDFALGSVFYISNPANNFTINIINLSETNSRAINVTVFLQQGLSPFNIIGFEINGVTQPIKWVGGLPPAVAPGTINAYVFNILRSGFNWVAVLGSGGVYA
jgi:hypothetical protein